MIRAFVQARMTSSRFPGKVLAPFRGVPLIRHVLRAVQGVSRLDSIVVATSTDEADDPLVAYLDTLSVTVFRGPLANVFERFRLCALQFPCEWILRVNADSPLWSAHVGQAVIDRASAEDCDLVTTIFPRTFPQGQNAELIRVSAFTAIDPATLSPHEQEHVTQVYYRHPTRYRIVNVESGKAELATCSLAVDTIDDLRRLENLPDGEIALTSSYDAPADGKAKVR